MSREKITVSDSFWLHYRELIRREMIPYQWKVLNDEADITIERERDDASIPNEKSHAIENFRIAAGRTKGTHYGWVFQDSDVYKWLEAVAYSLNERMDEDLRRLADEVVELIGEAQEADGYLGTYFTICEPRRKFRRLSESHELYCAGHLFEAAAAYYEATGNERILRIACRLADCVDSYFGEEEGKHYGFDGHEEIEIGLMRLYRVTGEERYRKLAGYFLYARGQDPDFFRKQNETDPGDKPLLNGMDRLPLSYFQADRPVTEQDTARGHAVRQVYLCTAMADMAATAGDEKLLAACGRIWRNIVDRQMYITGGIGATVLGEAFTFDYDLPNDTMYCETCASIGLIFFARQMLRSELRGEYGDVMERALYNTALAGMALDGKHFFYVNPLSVDPGSAAGDPGKSHVKPVRPQWLGCACCPPNLARLLASIENYVYIQRDGMLAAVLFMNCEGSFETARGRVKLTQRTGYPWDGTVCFELDCEEGALETFAIRLPGWSESFRLTVNGREMKPEITDGFLVLHGSFGRDSIVLELDMGIKKWYAHPAVKADTDRTAISRGPFIYCMESADNGRDLHLTYIRENTELTYRYRGDMLGGVGVIEAEGYREEISAPGTPGTLPLYRRDKGAVCSHAAALRWIPYYSWANRGEGEMQVWVRELPAKK